MESSLLFGHGRMRRLARRLERLATWSSGSPACSWRRSPCWCSSRRSAAMSRRPDPGRVRHRAAHARRRHALGLRQRRLPRRPHQGRPRGRAAARAGAPGSTCSRRWSCCCSPCCSPGCCSAGSRAPPATIHLRSAPAGGRGAAIWLGVVASVFTIATRILLMVLGAEPAERPTGAWPE